MNYTDFSDSDTSLYGITSLADSPSGNAPDNNVGDFKILRLGTSNEKYNILMLSSPRFDGLYIGKFWDGNWQGWKQLASTSDLAASQNNSYVVTLQNTINNSLFSNAQYRSRRTQNGTGAAAYGFENVGENSGALYLDPSDYKLHFINYDGKKFIINWTAEN